MDYLKLGSINDSFGLDGTLKIYCTSNMSSKRYETGNTVFLFNPLTNERVEYKVLSFRHNGLFDFVKLEGIDNPEDAKALKGFEVHVKKDRNDLEEGSYFYSDLKGCKVYDQDHNELGIVKEVEEFPAQLTLRVMRKGKPDFFVPYVKQFIKAINIENKEILIEKIEGLLWKLQFWRYFQKCLMGF